MSNYEDKYTIDTKQAQDGVKSLESRVKSLGDRVDQAGSKLDKMNDGVGKFKSRMEAARDGPEIVKNTIAGLGFEFDGLTKSIDFAGSAATSVAAGFMAGGPIGAGIAGGIAAIGGLIQVYSYLTAEVKKSATEIKDNFMGGLTPMERKLKEIHREMAKLEALDGLNYDQQLEYLKLLDKEKAIQEAVRGEAEAKAKAQQTSAAAAQAEIDAYKELMRLRGESVQDKEVIQRTGEVLAQPGAMAQLIDILRRSSGSNVEAKNALELIQKGRIEQVGSLQAQDMGQQTLLSDLRAIVAGRQTSAEIAAVQRQAANEQARQSMIAFSQQRANEMAARTAPAEQAAAPESGLTFTQRVIELERQRSEAKAAGDAVLAAYIEMLSNDIVAEQERARRAEQASAEAQRRFQSSLRQTRPPMMPTNFR